MPRVLLKAELCILVLSTCTIAASIGRAIAAEGHDPVAPATAPLSYGIQGERDTLLKQIDRVQSMLQERKRLDAVTEQQLGSLQQELGSDSLTLETIEALRERLGVSVGRAARKEFPETDFVAWSRSRWAELAPHDWPSDSESKSLDLTINMARDAVGSAALVATNTRDTPVEIDVSMAPTEGAPRVTLRRGWHVACPDRQYRPDVLALISDQKFTLRPGETTLLWFEVDSHGTKAGTFDIPVKLTAGKTVAETRLQVEVYDVVLPRVFDCALFNYSYLDEMGWIRDFKDAALKDLDDHRINTSIIPGYLPMAKADAQGNLTTDIDFSAVDRQIQLYRPHSRQIGIFWEGDCNRHLKLFPELEFLSEPWRKAVSAWYQQWISHLDEMGLKPGDYFMYVYDERSSPEVQQVYAMLKQVAPEVPLLLNPTSGYKPEELRAIAPYVDIWMPSYEALVRPHPEDFEFIKSTGAKVWIYSCSNGTPLPTYDYNLRRHWIGWDLGVTGIAQWAYADNGGWNSTNSWEFVNGDFAMVYAKPHAPKELKLTETLTPSRRWEAWREGSQDFQLLNLARTAAAKSDESQAKLNQAVSLVVSNTDDSQAADRARTMLLQVIADSN